MKLLTIADGFGDSSAVPKFYPKYWKWPKIISLMTKGLSLIDCSRYGAGNEFIVSQLKQHVGSVDRAIVQWAKPDRLDLILSNNLPDFWKEVIDSDPVYKDNVVMCGDNTFWISSDSKTDAVKDYHKRYISLKQHQSRSQMYVEYAKLLLESSNVDYRFMLTENSQYLNVNANWMCHEPFKGMSDFNRKSKYYHLDLGFVQPIPLVAFDFIKQHIMPSIDLCWRSDKEIDAVENMLYKHYQEAVKNRNDQI